MSFHYFVLSYFSNLKNLYGNFWKTTDGFHEYYLKLDGHYYCKRKKCIFTVIRVRNKRTTDIIPLRDIINDKEYLKELHPMDTCVIGILANNERNGIIDHKIIGWHNMHRSKEYPCKIKSIPILEISRRYIDENGNEIVVLRSKFINKEIELTATELCLNQALVYALDSFQAIAIGYEASVSMIRN